MSTSTTTSALIDRAHEALERAVTTADHDFASTGDNTAAAAEVLDALARVSTQVPQLMARVTGAGDDTVARLAEQLSTALVAHRNLTLNTRARPTSG